jgi:hypothetical protein
MRWLTLLLIAVFGMALFASAAVRSTVAQTVVTVTPSPGGPLATYTFAPFVTRTPLPTLTFAPFPTDEPCAAPLRLSVGNSVTLTPGVNVRSLPSLSGAVVNYYTEEVLLTVVEGPVCANGYNWWRVAGVGEPGWVIEGRPGRYFLTFVPTPTDSVCYTPLPLRAGSGARLVTGLLVRVQPDASAFVITALETGFQVTLLEGPVCEDGLNWYRVRVPYGSTSALVDGWIAEGYPENYYLQPLNLPAPTPWCPRALRLGVGSRAAVTYTDGVPRRLRSAPSSSAPVVQELIAGVPFDILTGAVCAEGYNWWYVQIVGTSLTGWIAEGRPGNYWFEIIYQAPR